MELNNFCIRVPFTAGKDKGYSYYFVKGGKVVNKTMSWDVDVIRFDEKFTNIWLEKRESAIVGAYTETSFRNSSMKFNFNGDKLVFNTIFNTTTKKDCLLDKFRLGWGEKEDINIDEFKIITLIDFINVNSKFKKLFYLYNKTLIKSSQTLEMFDENDELFFKESVKEIIGACNNDPTKPQEN